MLQTQYILVHFVETQKIGHRFIRSRAEWPLHITLIPWFTVHAELTTPFIAALTERAQQCCRFDATVGEEHAFTAPNGDKRVPVNLMANQKPFRNLHNQLLNLVRDYYMSFEVTNPYIGDRFRAHITHHTKDGVVYRCTQGDTLHIKDFSLVRLIPGKDTQKCEVVENFYLTEDHEATTR
jgi:2'-5' RNA ligase